MKNLFKIILSIALVICLSFTTVYAGGEGDVEIDNTLQNWIDEGYPVVTRVYDSCAAVYAQLSTDQTGDYVSVFVKGYNINIDTVKPVFYDENGAVISGDVCAVETVSSGYYQGAYFRIKKLESDAWDIENTRGVNSKTFTVKLEPVSDKEIKYENEYYSEKVEIYRRDVYYTSFDNIRNTLTLYFSTGVDADTNVMPDLVLGYHYYDSETGTYPMNVVKETKAVKFTKEVNKFTGQQETKAVFSMDNLDYDNAFGYYSPQFDVTFVNSKTKETETYDSYTDYDLNQIVGRTSFFPQTYEKSYVNGNRDTILYYPYWIGGVYKFDSYDSKHFLTKEEAEYLGNERFAYADYEEGKGSLTSNNFRNREYSYTFFISDIPQKPNGIPQVSVTKNGEDYILNWNKITNATGYRIYAVFPDGTSFVITETDKLTYTFNENLLKEFSEMGGENVQLKICAYSEKNSSVIEGDLSPAISLTETQPQNKPESQPQLNVSKKTLSAGKTLKLSVKNANGKNVTYTSDKTSVATVNKTTGVITTLKKGTAKITAKIGDKKLTCVVTVKNSPEIKYNKKVAKNNKVISVKKGKTIKLSITGKVASIKNKVTTSKKAVTKITSNAKNNYVKIKATKKGTSTVKITINNVVTYKYKIKVN